MLRMSMFYFENRNKMLRRCCFGQLLTRANKKQLKILMNSPASRTKQNKNQLCKQQKKAVWKCKFKLTNNLYNQLVAVFFHFANYLNTIFRSLSSWRWLRGEIQFTLVGFATQSSAYLSALCLLTWKVLLTFHFWRCFLRNPKAHLQLLNSTFSRLGLSSVDSIHRRAMFLTNEVNEEATFHTHKIDWMHQHFLLVWSFNDHKIEDYGWA